MTFLTLSRSLSLSPKTLFTLGQGQLNWKVTFANLMILYIEIETEVVKKVTWSSFFLENEVSQYKGLYFFSKKHLSLPCWQQQARSQFRSQSNFLTLSLCLFGYLDPGLLIIMTLSSGQTKETRWQLGRLGFAAVWLWQMARTNGFQLFLFRFKKQL